MLNCIEIYQLPDSGSVFFPQGVSRYVTRHCRNNAKSSLYANIVAKRLLQACLAAQKKNRAEETTGRRRDTK